MVTVRKRLIPGEAAYKWLYAHESDLEPYVGQWVAIGPGGVVASALTAADAREASYAKGVRDAVVLVVRGLHAKQELRAK